MQATTVSGALLLLQGVAQALAGLAAPVLVEGIAPPDPPLTAGETADLRYEAGAVSAAMLVLAVVSLTAGVARLRGRRYGLSPLVAAHVGAALAVGWRGSPVLCVVLLCAAVHWALVQAGDARRPTGPGLDCGESAPR